MRTRVRWWGVLAACLAVTFVAVVAPTKAHAGTGVNYIERTWDGSKIVETQKWADCIEFNDVPSDGYVLNSGWYIGRNFSDGDRPVVNGTVNLILENGIDLRLRDGIRVPPGNTLNIYTHVYDNGTKDAGKFHVDRSEGDTAAIGGNDGEGCGTVNIYGGIVEVRGGSHNTDGGAGIGGGNKGGAGTINIYGGTVTAKGGPNAAGIGAGDGTDGGGDSGTVNIYGGTVNATGGSDSNNGGAGIGGGGQKHINAVNIYGGTTNAIGGANAAGIGGGAKSDSGAINISGGTVTARGDSQAAGIGGGMDKAGQNINISGGTIIATGGTGAAGIGGGNHAAGKDITISGGTVSATGGTSVSVMGGAGIGGGSKGVGENITIKGTANITKAQGGADAAGIGGGDGAAGKKIRIEGGKVKAQGGSQKDGGGAGIGGGQKKSGEVTITGGTVTATGGADGAGIGGGEDGGNSNDKDGSTITITGGTIKATGGARGAGIGSGEDGENAGTITISGGNVTAMAGDNSAGIGGGIYGGKYGNITIKGGHIYAEAGGGAAGIGSGMWSTSRFKGSTSFISSINITIEDGTVESVGWDGGAGIGGGSSGTSGKIVIKGGTVVAKGGGNGGAGIGSGSRCELENFTTVDVTIDGGCVTAYGGAIDSATNTDGDDPGAAIGTGGYEEKGTKLGTSIESYFVGHIWLNGGIIAAYAADMTKGTTSLKDNICVIGTSRASGREGEKGVVHFNGATVDMYTGKGTASIKQMVRATEVGEGGILFTDNEGMYQRVTYATRNVAKMHEAKGASRYAVVTGADGVEDIEGTKEQTAEYTHIKVEPQHKHDFEYSLKEGTTDTIVAECISGDCPLADHKAELQITKPQHEVYGDDKSADAVVVDNGRIRDGAKIRYFRANDALTEKIDEEGAGVLEQAPSDAGAYWAEITLPSTPSEDAKRNATAHVAYRIEKADNPATIEDTATVTVGGSIDLSHNVKNKPEYSNVEFKFKTNDELQNNHCTLTEGVLSTSEQTKETNLDTGAGEVVQPVEVEVTVKGDTNHKDVTQIIKVNVLGSPKQTISANEITATYGDKDLSVNATVKGNRKGATCGKLSYTVLDASADSMGDDAPIAVDEKGKLTIKKAGEANILVTAAATDVYPEDHKLVTVTISKASNPATIEPTASVEAGKTVDLSNKVHNALESDTSGGGVTYAIDSTTVGADEACELVDSTLYTTVGKPGVVTVNVTAHGNENYADLNGTITVTITAKLQQDIEARDVEVKYGDTTGKITAKVTNPPTGGGAISYIDYYNLDGIVSVSNEAENKGQLTARKTGTTYVTVKAAATGDYEETYKDVLVTVYKADNPAKIGDTATVQAGFTLNLAGMITIPEGSGLSKDNIEYEIDGEDYGCYLDGSELNTDSYSEYTSKDVKVNVTIPGNDNYESKTETITVTVTLTPTQFVVANDVATTYGATDAKIEATVIGSAEGKAPGSLTYAVTDEDGVSLDESKAPISVANDGTLRIKKVPEDGVAYVKVTVAKTEYYTEPASDIATVTIDKATLDTPATQLKIDNWTYGETAKTPTIEGLSIDIDLEDVTYEFKAADASDYEYASELPTNAPAGTYTVRATIEETNNYYGIEATKNFTIAKKHVDADVTVMPKEYDGTPDATVYATVKAEDLVGDDNIAIWDVTGLFANETITETDANAGVDKPVYLDASEATIVGGGADNYEIVVPETTTGTITKATAYILVNDVTVPFGQKPDASMLTAVDYVPVEGEELDYDLSCEVHEEVGEYPIKAVFDADVLPNSNYNIISADGTLTVANGELLVTANGYVGTYDGKPHGITVTAGPETAGPTVYYSAEKELSADNYQEGSTENPTFTDAGEYVVHYCVVASNYETVTGSQRVIIGKASTTIKAAPTPITGLVYNGKSQELVKAGKAEGGTLKYSLDYENWSESVPAATEAGPHFVFYRAEGDANHEDGDTLYVLGNIDNKPESSAPTYGYTDGYGLWVKGSTSGLEFTFKRFTTGDEGDTTFSHFKSASVDGSMIQEGSDYTKAEGSVILTLQPDYLNKLSSGSHTLKATFDDGSATAAFIVADADGQTISNKGGNGSTINRNGTTINNESSDGTTIDGESSDGTTITRNNSGGTTITTNDKGGTTIRTDGNGGTTITTDGSGGTTITAKGSNASSSASSGPIAKTSDPTLPVLVVTALGTSAALIGIKSRRRTE